MAAVSGIFASCVRKRSRSCTLSVSVIGIALALLLQVRGSRCLHGPRRGHRIGLLFLDTNLLGSAMTKEAF